MLLELVHPRVRVCARGVGYCVLKTFRVNVHVCAADGAWVTRANGVSMSSKPFA